MLVFTLWLNSLNVEPGVYNLFEDLKDGLILLQAFDKVVPGIVNWRMVSKKQPLSRFKMIENTNYCVHLGQERKFSLVGIQGADITDGTKTLTLGLVWQLMRENIIHTLQSLSKGGRPVTDQDMVRWANEMVQKGGKSSRMQSFRDPSLRSGIFFLDVLNGLAPGYVDYSLVTRGVTGKMPRFGLESHPFNTFFYRGGSLQQCQAGYFYCKKARCYHLLGTRGYRRSSCQDGKSWIYLFDILKLLEFNDRCVLRT